MSLFVRLTLPALAVLIVGCASEPSPEAMGALSNAESAYASIENDPAVASAAPVAKTQAKTYLEQAQRRSEKRVKDEELIYLSNLSQTWSNAAMAKTEYTQLDERLDATLSAQAAIARDGAELTDRGLILTPMEINFNLGKSDLDDTQVEKLDKLVNLLQQYPNLMLLVEGHTDGSGPLELNMDLSVSRTMTVINYLTAAGIDPSRLKGVGYGPALPKASNRTALGMQQNRRAEMVVNSGVMPPPMSKEGLEMKEAGMAMN